MCDVDVRERKFKSARARPYVSYSFSVCFPLVAFFDSTQKKVDLGDDYFRERIGPGSRATSTGTSTSTQGTSL